MKKNDVVHQTDVLVVGGGMAGCLAAIKAREAGAKVLLVDKGYVSSSGQTPFADSFCVFNEAWGDNMEEWIAGVSKGGDYVNNRDWTRTIFEGTLELYEDLCSYGIEFATGKDGKPLRFLYETFGNIATFLLNDKKESCRKLRAQVLKSGATILDSVMITDLIKEGDRVCGAVGMTVREGDFQIFHAKSVILATGAACLKGTGWPNASLTADGDMMAYRVGASITGKEYNDVHTTSPFTPSAVGQDFLRRKAMTGPPSANYINAKGELFSGPSLFHLAPEFEAHRGNAPVAWIRPGPPQEIPPGVIAPSLHPQGHLVVGGASTGMSTHKSEGIWPTDLEGGVGIDGLFAAGDSLGVMLSGAAYCTVGAALSGSGVLGSIVGRRAAAYAADCTVVTPMDETVAPLRHRLYAASEREGGFSPTWALQLLSNLMVPYFILGIKRQDRLEAALTMTTFYREHLIPKLNANDPHELRLALECENIATNCEMKLRASLMRQESRGTHYREDFPQRNDEEGLCWILLRDNGGKMEASKKEIPDAWKPDANLPCSEKYLYEFPAFEKEGV